MLKQKEKEKRKKNNRRKTRIHSKKGVKWKKKRCILKEKQDKHC